MRQKRTRRSTRERALTFEQLEHRYLLIASAAFSGGELIVTGAPSFNDNISIASTLNLTDQQRYVIVTANDHVIYDGLTLGTRASMVTFIEVDGSSGR